MGVIGFYKVSIFKNKRSFDILKASKKKNSNNHTLLELNQGRFFSNGDKPTKEESFTWKVPITITTGSSFPNVYRQILLEKVNDEIDIGVLEEGEWIKLNHNSIGFYRTNYSKEMLDNLVNHVKSKVLHPTDRLGLQNDAFALVCFKFAK